ncbi:hypothetical protein HHK36_006078 [Tetracentron sinense]|uniref:C3H1-type domain-containing protein n=1 Tax=Tetracentron sinense TaxID=13715 RepID=A0A834ZR75_TETSI|nr:hypothetical protein HHK36_006078 [Tetracentron sinense]
MEDETQKRNTDCVYFLASPLTCKKGIECEYRHSETARLNPRDCWYWLDGNCLNPTCAFRHPPLEGRTETSSESATLPHQSSVPVNKTNVPCYFYFNGFCNKGDRCSFLHGPNDVSSAWKPSKTVSTATDVHPLDNKTSAGNDTGPVSIKAPSNPSETALKVVAQQLLPKEDLHHSIANVMERSTSPQISLPDFQEVAVKSDSPLPAEDFVERRSLLCPDQSSEEEVNDHMEPEERWESSPGFDVLVDDGSENLGYEDDEYSLAHDREARGIHNHLLGYDFEDQVGYDPREYPDVGILYEHGVYESYSCSENGDIHNSVQIAPEHLRDRILDPMFRKRKLLPRELDIDDLNDVDLRDHLRKRRRIDGRQASRNPRRQGPSHLNDRSRELPGRHGMGRMLHGRLASEVGKNMIRSHNENETRSNDADPRGWSRHSHPRHSRLRQHDKERKRQARQQILPSEISSDSASREMRRPTQEFTMFTGPKTLSQIKEEKRKAREHGDDFRNSGRPSRTTSEEFQPPKPLSEILKEKRRLGSSSDDNTSTRLKHDYVEPETNHDYSVKDDDSIDEEDEE